MSTSISVVTTIFAYVLVVVGFLLPVWPLSVCGILLAALFGRWVTALFLGLMLDIAYGSPVGQWHILALPFTFCALIGVTLHHFFLSRIVRSRNDLL